MQHPNPRLADHLGQHPGRKDHEWAEMFGISRSHWNMIKNGTAQPSKAVMTRMETLTDGDVPILSWFAAPVLTDSKDPLAAE
jgi:hypothetical protein